MIVYQIENIIQGSIIKRPSAFCKTPYVADVLLENQEQIFGHSPSLGCCGLADKEATVLLSKVESKKTVCSHRVEISVFKEQGQTVYIGINPKLAEYIAYSCLEKNCLPFLKNVQSFKKEVSYLNSRFDFSGIDENGKTFYMEIKNVPLADYVDLPKKERKKHLDYIQSCQINEKISYFPDGYRKNKKEVVSPRALKHITELEQIALNTDYRAILCFVIQRTDVKQFQPSNLDIIYKEAVQRAYINGVEIRVLQVEWSKHGQATYIEKQLPIVLFETEGPHQLLDIQT